MEELFLAALNNDTAKIREYLKFGDVNITDKYHSSLLHYAARGNAIEVSNLLLDNYIETDGNSIITLNKTVGSENGIFNVLNNISKGNSYIGRFVSQTTLPSNINSVNNNII